MTAYLYECKDHGRFEVACPQFQPLASAPCPECGEDSGRRWQVGKPIIAHNMTVTG